jgi:deazaflavin-dependent oxidoreductase (nitroreductase family)
VGIPRIDPHRQRGPLGRAYVRFARSRFGRWLGINIATRIDPFLMRITGGRVTVALVVPVAMLTTRGARSGQERVNPIVYFNDAEDVVLVASSFGREKHPAWYHNIRANPDVSLRVGGHEARFVGQQVEGPERERLWELACRVYPGYEDYRVRASHRQIPVLRLTPSA